MISVTAKSNGETVDMELPEFERRSRSGEIRPHDLVRFPAITGRAFVPAEELEIYQDLYSHGPINFRNNFHLRRLPVITVAVMGLAILLYWLRQEGPTTVAQELSRFGAKNITLMLELGQWWRIPYANFVHVSGLHLGINVVFLFHLGGPAEAIYRRLDYFILLVVSAFGSMGLSALLNPAVSCGLSGVVFGVWGALIVFALRHRALLPKRYARYFIVVVAYAFFALYVGLVMPLVDNWSHLGGLLSGAAWAIFMPPRLVVPRDEQALNKSLLVAGLALLVLFPSTGPSSDLPLSFSRYYPTGGLLVPIPRDWDDLLAKRTGDREAYAFGNGAGVAIGFETERLVEPALLTDEIRRFVEVDIAEQISVVNMLGLRLSDPIPIGVAGRPGQLIQADILTQHGRSSATYVFTTRGHYRYVLSFSAPSWLAGRYAPLFQLVTTAINLVPTDAVLVAAAQVEEHPSPELHYRLAMALTAEGNPLATEDALIAGLARWSQLSADEQDAFALFVLLEQPSPGICQIAERRALLKSSPAREQPFWLSLVEGCERPWGEAP